MRSQPLLGITEHETLPGKMQIDWLHCCIMPWRNMVMGKIQKDSQGNAIINTVSEETGFRAGENGENVFGH